MNLIGIDPSITSTGLTINGKLFSYSYNTNALKKDNTYTKWFEISNPYLYHRLHDKVEFDNYGNEQVNKLVCYKKVVEQIYEDIIDFSNPNESYKIAIEGYSYASATGNLIDLVTFSTLLRDKFLLLADDFEVLAPSTLKLETCKMSYPPIKKEKGKRKKKIVYEYRNNDGLSGGNFEKIDMYNAIIEKDDWGDLPSESINWIKHLKQIKNDFNRIPKPYDDVNDSFLLYLYLKNNI